MRAVEFAGPLADPQEVAGQRVPVAHQRHLVVEQQGLVTGEQFAAGRLGHRVQYVERGAGAVVRGEHPPRVRCAGLGRRREAVDDVAPVGGQPVRARRAGARLGVLPGDASDRHHRQAGGDLEQGRAVQQGVQVGAHVLGGVAGEGLGAVPALDDQGPAERGLGQALPEPVHGGGLHQGRQGAERGAHLAHPFLIGPLRLLAGGQARQGPGEVGPGAVVRRGGRGGRRGHRSRHPVFLRPARRSAGRSLRRRTPSLR